MSDHAEVFKKRSIDHVTVLSASLGAVLLVIFLYTDSEITALISGSVYAITYCVLFYKPGVYYSHIRPATKSFIVFISAVLEAAFDFAMIKIKAMLSLVQSKIRPISNRIVGFLKRVVFPPVRKFIKREIRYAKYDSRRLIMFVWSIIRDIRFYLSIVVIVGLMALQQAIYDIIEVGEYLGTTIFIYLIVTASLLYLIWKKRIHDLFK